MTDKFGCNTEQAIHLLRLARSKANRVGLSFHVGSQTVNPQSYADAIDSCDNLILRSGIKLGVFDIGGGFPIPGLGMDIPPLMAFFKVIRERIATLHLPRTCEIWSEPGRALSGTASVFVTRVELRKGQVLHINDGTFGNMFEIASGKWRNTVHMIRPARKNRKAPSKNKAAFSLYGPFILPDDIGEGDYIALEGMGAYMAASRSHFNGFYSDLQVEITGEVKPATTPPRQRSAAKRSHLKVVK